MILSELERVKKISGIKIVRASPPINHLFFADDSLFFTKATRAEVQAMVKALEFYSVLTGWEINFQKLAACFSLNTGRAMKRSLARLLNLREVACHKKYLGLPSSLSYKKIVSFGYIKDKMWKHLQNWKEKLFSVGGK